MICASCHGPTPFAPCASCGDDPTLEGRYTLLSVVAEGATATLYRATDARTGAVVAIKERHPRGRLDETAERLFEREGRVLRQLDHPRIPRYVDAFAAGRGKARRHYLVQEFVDGHALALDPPDRRRTVPEVWRIVAELAEILTWLHGLSPPVIHRDLKPGNVLERADGRLVLVDFGAVRDADPGTLGGHTVAGTFGFMAPEQFMGEASPASDVFGLGALAIGLLTRRHPAALHDRTGRFHWRRGLALPSDGIALLDAMTDPDPSRRPSAAEVARRARALAEARAAASAATPPPPARPPAVATARSSAHVAPWRPVQVGAVIALLGFGGFAAFRLVPRGASAPSAPPPPAMAALFEPGARWNEVDVVRTLACLEGDRDACVEVSDQLVLSDDPENGLLLWEHACALEVPSACYHLAHTTWRGLLTPAEIAPDRPRAVHAALAGCAARPDPGAPWMPDALGQDALRWSFDLTDPTALRAAWAACAEALLVACTAPDRSRPAACGIGLAASAAGWGGAADPSALRATWCATHGDPVWCAPPGDRCGGAIRPDQAETCAEDAWFLWSDRPDDALAQWERACAAGSELGCRGAAAAWGREPDRGAWRPGWRGDDPVRAWHGWSRLFEGRWVTPVTLSERLPVAIRVAEERGVRDALEVEIRGSMERLAAACRLREGRSSNWPEIHCRQAFELAGGAPEGPPRDPELQRRTAREACDLGWNFGCVFLR